MGFGFKQPLVGKKRCVTTLITAAKEAREPILQNKLKRRTDTCYEANLLKVQPHLRSYVPVKSKLQHPSPPGNPQAFEFFAKFLFKFPPPEAEKLFKCPIIGLFQVIKCPHPRETFRELLLCSGSCVCKHGLRQHSYMPKII